MAVVGVGKEDLMIKSGLIFLRDGNRKKTRVFFRDIGKRVIRCFLCVCGQGIKKKENKNQGL